MDSLPAKLRHGLPPPGVFPLRRIQVRFKVSNGRDNGDAVVVAVLVVAVLASPRRRMRRRRTSRSRRSSRSSSSRSRSSGSGSDRRRGLPPPSLSSSMLYRILCNRCCVPASWVAPCQGRSPGTPGCCGGWPSGGVPDSSQRSRMFRCRIYKFVCSTWS